MNALASLAGVAAGVTVAVLAAHSRRLLLAAFSRGDNASAGLECKRPVLGPVHPVPTSFACPECGKRAPMRSIADDCCAGWFEPSIN